ncbi:MAG: hypothetical protein U9N63_07635 [Pseudomonadota bacterium]|nr:hypothetical protein [Pseudomonadota bacterium]
MKREISLSAGRVFHLIKQTKILLLLSIIIVSVVISMPLMAEEDGRHESLLDLAALLKEKEATLNSREAALDEKKIRIEILQKELRTQELEMQEIRVSVEKILDEFKSLKEEDLSRLVEVYTAMKPAAAAPLLSELELKYAVEVILRMPPKKSAKLLSAVEAERAIAISRAITELKHEE